MSIKQNSAGCDEAEPTQVFRQFAWHLAGSLATAKSGVAGAASKPAKSSVKR